MVPVVAAISVVLVVLVVAAAIHVVLRGRGNPPSKTFWALIGFQTLVVGICVWAFASHRPFVGIATLVVGFVFPEIVLIPLRVRRSHEAAEATRRARQGRRDG